jgi:hypothetical protein
VIKRYEDAGCRIFRTYKDGAISLETDGKRVWIKTHAPAGAAPCMKIVNIPRLTGMPVAKSMTRSFSGQGGDG